jgi:hypothetical protein
MAEQMTCGLWCSLSTSSSQVSLLVSQSHLIILSALLASLFQSHSLPPHSVSSDLSNTIKDPISPHLWLMAIPIALTAKGLILPIVLGVSPTSSCILSFGNFKSIPIYKFTKTSVFEFNHFNAHLLLL